jgi:hypothetical protein
VLGGFGGFHTQFTANVFPQCVPQQRAWTNCTAAGAPGAANWNCDAGLPTGCFDEQDAFFACLNGG